MKFEKKERLLATLNADVFDSDPYNAIFNSFFRLFLLIRKHFGQTWRRRFYSTLIRQHESKNKTFYCDLSVVLTTLFWFVCYISYLSHTFFSLSFDWDIFTVSDFMVGVFSFNRNPLYFIREFICENDNAFS